MNCKETLRREMIKRRKAEGKKENGVKITQVIRNLKEYKNARTVMLYMPIQNEIDVTRLMSDDKLFVVPVVDGDNMYPCITGEMEKGTFGVPEPIDKEVFDKNKIDVVIVPGVAFDKEFNCMGFGKGYYDKFLEKTNMVKIGICHAFQMLDGIPSDDRDVKMDIIVTEEDTWRRGSIL